MSADRELLELAAKAAGILYDAEISTHVEGRKWWGLWLSSLDEPSEFARRHWNPLTDDGDALRLAVKLRMDVKQWNSLVIAVKAWNSHAEENTFTQCPYAATRRAIVRAAAAIGKAKP